MLFRSTYILVSVSRSVRIANCSDSVNGSSSGRTVHPFGHRHSPLLSGWVAGPRLICPRVKGTSNSSALQQSGKLLAGGLARMCGSVRSTRNQSDRKHSLFSSRVLKNRTLVLRGIMYHCMINDKWKMELLFYYCMFIF